MVKKGVRGTYRCSYVRFALNGCAVCVGGTGTSSEEVGRVGFFAIRNKMPPKKLKKARVAKAMV